MKTYVMSDIHGRDTAYFDMLEQIEFANFCADDRLYILGDCIDRGEGSTEVLMHIYHHRDKITLLMGNHEQMMLKAFYTGDAYHWFDNGGEYTYNSFSLLEHDVQIELLEYISQLPHYSEIQVNGIEFYLVHASPHYPFSDKHSQYHSEKEQMVWRMMRPEYKIERKTVVFGHKFSAYYHENFNLKHYNKAYLFTKLMV